MAQFNITYYNRKEKGICTYCGKRKAVENQIMCQTCKDKKKGKITSYYRRKQSGLCVSCGEEKPIEGQVLCSYCKKMNLVKRLHVREERRKDGLCSICGRPKTVEDIGVDGILNLSCRRCLDKMKSYHNKEE